MGIIRDVIKEFDQSDELAQVQREAVEALAALGQSKADTFELEIEESLFSAGQGTNKTVPVTTIIKKLTDVRAYSSTEVGNIGTVVTDALKSFMTGTAESVLDGVGNLITDTLSIFLGKASASTGTVEEYYVTTEGLSVVRVDMKAWYLNVSAESIQKKMERVTAVVAVKSIVDLSKIDFGTFLNLYQQQLYASGIDSSDIKAALNEAKQIYKDFKDVNGDSVKTAQSITKPPAEHALKRKK